MKANDVLNLLRISRKTLHVTDKHRLSRGGFELFKYLFQKFGTEMVVISEIGDQKMDSEEIFNEILSTLHCYSMKLYSRRKNHSIEVGYEDNTN